MNIIVASLSPGRQWLALRSFAAMVGRQRELIWELTKRELLERHAGQVIGGAWMVIAPLVTMLVYTAVFTAVFSARGSSLLDDGTYAAYLLAGLIPWLAAQEAMSRSVRVVVDSGPLVKQILFPAEVLPVKTALAAMVSEAVMLLLFGILAVMQGKGNALMAALPLLIFAQALFLIGIAYALSAASVFLRDTREIITLFLGFGLFVAPIPYIPDALPQPLTLLFYANPFSYMVWCFQDVLYFGAIRHGFAWVIFPVLSVFTAVGGYRFFRSLEPLFGERL